MQEELSIYYNQFLENSGKLLPELADEWIHELENFITDHQKVVLNSVPKAIILKKLFVSAYETNHYDICYTIKEVLNTKGDY